MTFLNPLFLFGLAAAALPVLIHLFSRRRTRTVPYPSTDLLEGMRTDRMRRLNIRQWLLVALRALAVACIVLAFARPALHGSLGGTAETAAVILVDGSAGMTAVYEGDSLFDTAVRRARDILAILGPDDRAAVIMDAGGPVTFAGGPDAVVGGPIAAVNVFTANRDSLAAALNGLAPSFAANDPGAAYNAAWSLLNAAGAPNLELFHISDGSRGAYPDSLPAAAHPIRVYNIVVGPGVRTGPVITGIVAAERLVATGGTASVRAEALAAPDAPVTVELSVNGDRIDRVIVPALPDVPAPAEFTVALPREGWYRVAAAVSDGRFPEGEIRRLVFRVPPRQRVLVVGDPGDRLWTVRALTAAMEGADIAVLVPEECAPGSFVDRDVAVLAGVRSLPRESYAALVTAVAGGMGLMVFPPDAVTDLYTGGIFRDLLPAEVVGRIAAHDSRGPAAIMDRFDMTHPTLAGIVESGTFRKPEVVSYLRFRPEEGTAVPVLLSDDSPAVAVRACGQGEVMVFAVGPGPASSDLPLSGIFAPLMSRSVRYLADVRTTGTRYEVGDLLAEPVPSDRAGGTVLFRAEEGVARSVTVEVGGRHGVATGVRLDLPGFYSLSDGDTVLSMFSVNIPASEVVYVPSSQRPDDGNWRFRRIDAGDDFAAVLRHERYGVELAGLFLLGAMLLLGLEMVLARR